MIECSKHYLVFFGVCEISITLFAVKKKNMNSTWRVLMFELSLVLRLEFLRRECSFKMNIEISRSKFYYP